MQFLTAMAVLAQEDESSSNVALVLPESAELIAGIIAFSIVFFFVWKWAWPTINKTLEQRQAAIKGQIEQAESANVDAETKEEAALIGQQRFQQWLDGGMVDMEGVWFGPEEARLDEEVLTNQAKDPTPDDQT